MENVVVPIDTHTEYAFSNRCVEITTDKHVVVLDFKGTNKYNEFRKLLNENNMCNWCGGLIDDEELLTLGIGYFHIKCYDKWRVLD